MATNGTKEAVAARKLRLAKTMQGFFKAREEENCCLLNGLLPPKQEKLMQSIIKQAIAIEAAESSGKRVGKSNNVGPATTDAL